MDQSDPPTRRMTRKERRAKDERVAADITALRAEIAHVPEDERRAMRQALLAALDDMLTEARHASPTTGRRQWVLPVAENRRR